MLFLDTNTIALSSLCKFRMKSTNYIKKKSGQNTSTIIPVVYLLWCHKWWTLESMVWITIVRVTLKFNKPPFTHRGFWMCNYNRKCEWFEPTFCFFSSSSHMMTCCVTVCVALKSKLPTTTYMGFLNILPAISRTPSGHVALNIERITHPHKITLKPLQSFSMPASVSLAINWLLLQPCLKLFGKWYS